MTTVVERCEQLCRRLRESEDLRRMHHAAERLDERRLALMETRQRLEKSVRRLEAYCNNSKDIAILIGADAEALLKSIPDPLPVIERLTRIRDRFAVDPDQLTAGTDYAQLRSELGQVADQLQELTARVWERIRTATPPPVPDLEQHWTRIPSVRPNVERVRQLRKALDSRSHQPLDSADALREYLATLQQLRVATDELMAKGEVPPDVQAFLREAERAPGAPFSLFTDEIREWLDQNGAIESLRLRLAGDES